MSTDTASGRLAWVDIAKGICIGLVVLMHSTLGVEKAAGAPSLIHAFVEWARPFRMPDFFLISGLFLAARIDRPWRPYLDSKVLHFAYFYVLWLTIQFVLKAPSLASDGPGQLVADYATALIKPWGTLWFIYLLAVFFVVAKLAHGLPRGLVWTAAALLHMFAPTTGWLVADEFTSRFVFFFTGYTVAPLIQAFADRVAIAPLGLVAASLAAWIGLNTLAVASGLAFVPGLDLVISFIGIAAVVAFSASLARLDAGRALASAGRNSISIYLAFPLFMAPVRILLLGTAGWLGLEAISLAVASASLIGALALSRAVAGTRLSFLFVRPKRLKLGSLLPARPAGSSDGSRALLPSP